MDSEGATPLQIALEEGHTEVVRLLRDVSAADNNSIRVCVTSPKGRVSVVQTSAPTGAIACEQRSFEGPLHTAARKGHLEVVRLLCEARADKDEADKDGTTPLHASSQEGHVDVVRYPCAVGAKIDKSDNGRATSMNIAASKGHEEVLRVLCAEGAKADKSDRSGATQLFDATRSGHLQVVRLLCETKAEANKARKDGATPRAYRSAGRAPHSLAVLVRGRGGQRQG